jgi:hypothetical protein
MYTGEPFSVTAADIAEHARIDARADQVVQA